MFKNAKRGTRWKHDWQGIYLLCMHLTWVQFSLSHMVSWAFLGVIPEYQRVWPWNQTKPKAIQDQELFEDDDDDDDDDDNDGSVVIVVLVVVVVVVVAPVVIVRYVSSSNTNGSSTVDLVSLPWRQVDNPPMLPLAVWLTEYNGSFLWTIPTPTIVQLCSCLSPVRDNMLN